MPLGFSLLPKEPLESWHAGNLGRALLFHTLLCLENAGFLNRRDVDDSAPRLLVVVYVYSVYRTEMVSDAKYASQSIHCATVRSYPAILSVTGNGGREYNG